MQMLVCATILQAICSASFISNVAKNTVYIWILTAISEHLFVFDFKLSQLTKFNLVPKCAKWFCNAVHMCT